MTEINDTQRITVAQSADQMLVNELIVSMYGGIALMGQSHHKQMTKDAIDLAEKLQKSHTKLTEELKMYESDQMWLIPAGECDEDVETRQSLAKKNGAAYQQEWLELLRSRHETNIQKLEAANPDDPKLQKMGEKGVSTLKDLLNDIIDVQAGSDAA